MKYLKQFGIILLVSFAGELLNYIIPLPVPASIYGIVIMFLCLLFKIIPLDSVKDAGHFLVDIMPVMFIPPAVGVMEAWGLIKAQWIPYICITVISTIVVMGVSGKVTQTVIRHAKKKLK
ncbi:MAG: CidA/LrgA family protein, partial [Butyrivibrio sp.]